MKKKISGEEVIISKHAEKKAIEYGITAEKAREIFLKSKKRELKKQFWAYKFREHGLKEQEVEHYYYSGWDFVAKKVEGGILILTLSYPCKETNYEKK